MLANENVCWPITTFRFNLKQSFLFCIELFVPAAFFNQTLLEKRANDIYKMNGCIRCIWFSLPNAPLWRREFLISICYCRCRSRSLDVNYDINDVLLCVRVLYFAFIYFVGIVVVNKSLEKYEQWIKMSETWWIAP